LAIITTEVKTGFFCNGV